MRHKYIMRILSFILLILANLSLSAQDAGAIAKFNTWALDIGEVKQGGKKSGAFTFTNITDAAIQIDLVSTCECTEATWTKGPIEPGKSGTIEFVFDSNKKEDTEPVDVDVFFLNVNPSTDNPYTAYLQYTFQIIP